VLERDIDGERAETTAIENRDTRLGAVQACRRAARTVFLGSAPTTPNQMVRGIETERVMLGCAQPGQQTGVFKDALRRLGDYLHYLNSANNRFWFDTRPNLRREMEERKRRFQDKDDVVPAIRERLQKSFATGVFGGIHVFTPSGDVLDDWSLRLASERIPGASWIRFGVTDWCDRPTTGGRDRCGICGKSPCLSSADILYGVGKTPASTLRPHRMRAAPPRSCYTPLPGLL